MSSRGAKRRGDLHAVMPITSDAAEAERRLPRPGKSGLEETYLEFVSNEVTHEQ